MKRPYQYQGSEPLQISAETVFDTVKSIIEAGHEREFIAKCDKDGAYITIEPQFVNLVKDYLFEERNSVRWKLHEGLSVPLGVRER